MVRYVFGRHLLAAVAGTAIRAVVMAALAGAAASAEAGVFRQGETVIFTGAGQVSGREGRVVAVDAHGVFVLFQNEDGSYDAQSGRRQYCSKTQLRHPDDPPPGEGSSAGTALGTNASSGQPSFESGPIVPIRGGDPQAVRALPALKASAGSLKKSTSARRDTRRPAQRKPAGSN